MFKAGVVCLFFIFMSLFGKSVLVMGFYGLFIEFFLYFIGFLKVLRGVWNVL